MDMLNGNIPQSRNQIKSLIGTKYLRFPEKEKQLKNIKKKTEDQSTHATSRKNLKVSQS